MPLYLRKAFEDIAANRFLNAVSMITIALAVLIVSAFALFFLNATNLLDAWRQGVRLMVYLDGNLSEARHLEMKYQLQQMPEVREARFVGRDEALERLHRQMGPQASLLNGIEENPLPDAFEVELKPETLDASRVELLATRIAALQGVDEVSYGQQWLNRFGGLLKLFHLAGYSLGALFFMAAVFFVANTIRLVLYSRQEEVSIMRLVGASERFIRTPFYIEALIQGAVGGLLGLAVLYGLYLASLANVTASLGGIGFSFHFLPWHNGAMAIAAGMIVGWLGCFISLKQFLTAA